MQIPKSLSAALFTLLFSSIPIHAQLIDFETTPAGGVPVDDSFLSTPYNLTGGGTVSFYFDANNSGVFSVCEHR